MKRDMDLIRQILLKVEEHPPNYDTVALSFPGVDDATIGEHVHLLVEARLIDAIDCRTMENFFDWKPLRLTWDGHEFLGAACNETVWNKVTSVIREHGLGFTLELLKTALIEATKKVIVG
jgi:hypothetical protein